MSAPPTVSTMSAAAAARKAAESASRDRAYSPGERDMIQKHTKAAADWCAFIGPDAELVKQVLFEKRRGAT